MVDRSNPGDGTRRTLRSRSMGWLCLGAVLLLGLGCAAAPEGTASGSAMGPLETSVETFTEHVLLTGELIAESGHRVGVPRTQSWQVQVRWMAEDGEAVEIGDPVVEFDNTTFAKAVGENRLAVDQAYSELSQTRSELGGQLAEKEYRLSEAHAALEKARLEADIPEGLLARREYQERQLTMRKAELSLEKAAEEVESHRSSAEDRLGVIEIQLEKALRELAASESAVEALAISAPEPGTVVIDRHPWHGRKIEAGDTVWVGMPVLRVANRDRMRVRAFVSDVDDGRVTVGDPVEVVLDAFPDRVYKGRVGELAPVAQDEPGSSLRRFFQALVDLDELDPDRMRPGMSVKVAVSRDLGERVLAPRVALAAVGEEVRARLADGGWSEVELGPCDAWNCVVESGLEAGAGLLAVEEGP